MTLRAMNEYVESRMTRCSRVGGVRERHAAQYNELAEAKSKNREGVMEPEGTGLHRVSS